MFSSKSQHVSFHISQNPLIDRGLKWALRQHGQVFRAIRTRFAGEKSLGNGTVSIVVPFHNVENYLEAALESIQLQRYFDLQVVLVDDGSTDGSKGIASKFVEVDPRFTLIHTHHVGPGAARNAGLKTASGEFVAFVDGDDILPIGAIYKLVDSLSNSGSAFAVGAFEHLRGSERWRSPWVAREHQTSRRGVSLDQVPGITRNVFPWNKLFRRDFFEATVTGFPEGIVYEDQVPIALAYTSGRKFDVLNETVYHWRQRQTHDSITQRRQDIEHLRNRVSVFKQTNEIYLEHSSRIVYREWLVKSLAEDMMPFIEASGSITADYWNLLREACLEIRGTITQAEWELVEPFRRDRVQAVLENRYDDLIFLLTQ